MLRPSLRVFVNSALRVVFSDLTPILRDALDTPSQNRVCIYIGDIVNSTPIKLRASRSALSGSMIGIYIRYILFEYLWCGLNGRLYLASKFPAEFR